MKKLNREQSVDYLLQALLLLVLIVSLVLVLNYLFPALRNILGFIVLAFIPFIIAWLVSILTEPFIGFMNKKLRIPKGFAVVIMILLVLGTIVVITTFILARIWTEISNAINALPIVTDSLNDFIESVQEILEQFNDSTNVQFIQDFLISAVNTIGQWLPSLLPAALNVLQATPAVMIFLLVTIMGIFFLCKDHEDLKTSVFSLFPAVRRARALAVYDNFAKVVRGYFWAQVLLVSINMVIAGIFFWILGIKGPLTVALLVGMLDFLPVVGPTLLIVPLGILGIVTGSYFMGFGMFILLVVLTVVRNILEPKVVGDRIGIKPLYTLIAIFVGMKLFGLVGIALGPILLALGACLYRSAKMTE